MSVVSLLTDTTARARLVEALRGAPAELYECGAAADARARLARGDVRMLVLSYRDARGTPLPALVAEARRDYATVTVVAFWTPGADGSERLLELVRAGAHMLVTRGIDDEPRLLRFALRDAEHRCTADLVLGRLQPRLPPPVVPLITLYLRTAGPPPSVSEAAASLGVHRKTLVNRLAAAGFPPPRALRTWCRLFAVARCLEDAGRTVESIAMQLDFDSATGLRNMLKRYTGYAPQQVRAAGGLDCVIACFVRSCEARRAAEDGRSVGAIALVDGASSTSVQGLGTENGDDDDDDRPYADAGVRPARARVAERG